MTDSCDVVVFGSVLTPAALRGGARAEFVATRGDRIVAVGSRDQGEAWARQAGRVIDVGVASVTAGFVDAHIHPIAGFDLTRGVDLSGLRTWDGVRAALAEEIARNPEGWVFGSGFDPTAFEGREWSNAILDGVADGRLVVVTSFDAHAALVSEAALQAAGVTGRETFAGSSRVGVDDTGRPTGVLYEVPAQALLGHVMPQPSFDERVDALHAVLTGMAESGLTGGQMLDFAVPESLDILVELERRTELPIWLRVSPWVMPGAGPEQLAELAEMQGRRGRRWEVRGIKLMIDGTVDNGTAWLFEPDSHGESVAPLWLNPDEYVEILAYFDARDIPVTTHAIGDRGVSFVARAIAGVTSGRVTHRIEHIETIPDDVIAEIAASRAATSMQPTHCTHFATAGHSDNWSQRLGPERAGRGWRIRDLRDAGVVVALGSDWPIAPFDPRGIVAAVQTRRPAGAPEIAPVIPEQGISATRAVEGFTSEYWRSVGEDGGEIVVGGRADLSVFSVDPITAAPDDFAQAEVILTVVAGEVVVDARANQKAA
jgi:predicted amidohydrolase YtcJ